MKPLHLHRRALTTAAILAVAGLCLGADKPRIFSHAAHTNFMPSCAHCHPNEKGSERPALSWGACRKCHEAGAPTLVRRASSRKLTIVFAHRKHAASFACKDCHATTIADAPRAAQTSVTYEQCRDCHWRKLADSARKGCAACHGGEMREQKPSDHRAGWTRMHGREANWRDTNQHGQDCAPCHRRSTCTECHMTRRPGSHTGLWSTRGHGFSAAWDADVCKTCHETGACVRCHRTTAPLNHRGAWRSTHGLAARIQTNEHCTACHSAGWCAACHKGK